jgi:hypothetical protein
MPIALAISKRGVGVLSGTPVLKETQHACSTAGQETSFMSLTPDQLVPEDHPIRRITVIVEGALAALSADFDLGRQHLILTRRGPSRARDGPAGSPRPLHRGDIRRDWAVQACCSQTADQRAEEAAPEALEAPITHCQSVHNAPLPSASQRRRQLLVCSAAV